MADWITDLIAEHGYLALVLLMFLENIFPPIPSELIMPFAGYAAAKGDINPIAAVARRQRGFVAWARLRGTASVTVLVPSG